jgi:hypothetical protein
MRRMLVAAGGAAVLLGAALGVSYAQSAPSHPLAHVRKDELAVAARALGVADVKALRHELRGSTLSAVAQTHNVQPTVVADAIKADLDAKIQAAVSAGTIKAQRVTKLQQRVADKVQALMARQFRSGKPTG